MRERSKAPMRSFSVPRIMLGALLTLGCSFAFAVITLRSEGPQGVLATRTALQAGHQITAQDLITVRVRAGSEAGLIPARRTTEVINRTARVPMVAGAMLNERALGEPAYPQSGQAIIGVAVKPGQYPPSLAVGDRVGVIAGAQAQTQAAQTEGQGGEGTDQEAGKTQPQNPEFAVAVVDGMEKARDPQSTAVVSLLLTESDAQAIARATAHAAAAQPEIALIKISPEGT